MLAKAPLAELEAAWQGLGDKPRYRLLRPSETGLVMVRGRIGGSGQPFNFGEMTMTRAAVQFVDAANAVSHTGFGHVAGRSARRKAEAGGRCSTRCCRTRRGTPRSPPSSLPLAERQQSAAKAAQAAKVMASKVDFFTMVRGE